jgi:4-hydroxy 2-oxovalerate aldolase
VSTFSEGQYKISRGDGLAGSSIQYGCALHSDEEKLSAANEVVKNSKIAVLLLPGIGKK